MSSSDPRRGAALLELIVSVTLLMIAGLTTTSMVLEASDTVRRAEEAEKQLRQASAFLHAVALWPSVELDQRLGIRPQGFWWLRIERPREHLYEITLVAADSTVLLETIVYRPGEG